MSRDSGHTCQGVRQGGDAVSDRCLSYNRQTGELPEVVLPRPDWMPEGERVNGVPVDHCLADAVQHLWDNGVVTLSSCCGHGKRRPSLVLGNGEDPGVARRLIAEVDGREFNLHQWRLVDVGAPVERPDPTRVVNEAEAPECSCGGVHMGPDRIVAWALGLVVVAAAALLGLLAFS